MEPVDFAIQRIKDVALLAEQFGTKKVNLIHPDGGSEGIWCVPVTADDDRKMRDDESKDDKVRVYLCNPTLDWGGRSWGAEVIATTMGDKRPVAVSADQTELDDDARRLFAGLSLHLEQQPPKELPLRTARRGR